ncbi:transcription factor A, mitochondrial-like isoform X2 [Centruroides sculpturatus]|nr:transcription factor A, mitochondrial-like isoform X2 [Centruroides sculpturatus]
MVVFGFAAKNTVFSFSRVLTEIRNISFKSWFANTKEPCLKNTLNANPSRPKKPLTSYMLFIKEKRNEMFGNNSKVSGKDQIKILSEKWRSLSEAEKQMYIKKYQESAIEYTKQHEAYMNSLTKEEHQALEDKLQMRKESQKRLKSALQKLDKPVGPRSPYNFFIAERASMTFGTKANETLKKIGQEWKDLPEERKE